MVRGTKEAAARRIQQAIGEILLGDWDPIGVRDVREAHDEYDGYVGGVYRLLASGASPPTVAEHLCAIEAGRMGYTQVTAKALPPVAKKLCSLNVRLEPE